MIKHLIIILSCTRQTVVSLNSFRYMVFMAQNNLSDAKENHLHIHIL